MTTTPEFQTKILEDFLHDFLPEGLLDYFEPVMAEDKEHQVEKDEVYKRDLHLYFDERDNRTLSFSICVPTASPKREPFATSLRGTANWFYTYAAGDGWTSNERMSYSTYASLPARHQVL